MTTIRTIMDSLPGAPKRPTRTKCTICGAPFPRRKGAAKCDVCGGTRLSNTELNLLKVVRTFDDPAHDLERLLRRLQEHDAEALAWAEGQLQFVVGLNELGVSKLDLVTQIARGYVSEGTVLELFRAAHPTGSLDLQADAPDTLH